ncbi:hypothetical protein [Fodinibius sp. Rm-B-1B1-1]
MSKESETNHVERFIERNHKKAGVKKVPGDTPLEKRINKNRIESGRKPKS